MPVPCAGHPAEAKATGEHPGATAAPEIRPSNGTLPCGKGDDLANETDFLDLYRRLKLSPGCDLHEFKQAYRRHVSLLHPDRRGSNYLDARAAELLQRLTAQYRAAMEFHRRHGRLPGAAAAPRAAAEFIVPIPRCELAAPGVARRSRMKMLALLVFLATAVLSLSLTSLSSPSETDPMPEGANEDVRPSESAAAPTLLSLGMPAETVRAIEGDPDAIHDGRWDYGPSWINFDHGEVVDWHSSPLHSLKVTSIRPPRRRP